MSMWDDYSTRLTINGTTQRERTITIAKDVFVNQSIDNPAYRSNATNNGIIQPLLLESKHGTPYKSTIIAMPGDSLLVGDMIENDGEHWLVVETTTTNPIQTIGTAWLCNQLFKFQNGTTTIIEKYGVFDDGSYSYDADKQIVTQKDGYTVYLPNDDDTKKLFVGKRLAINTSYNKDAEQELFCVKINTVDSVSKNYGTGSHLILLDVESSEYSSTLDSIENMVCNYISSDSGGSTGELLPCSITTARSSIRTGTSYTYAVTFYEADGVTVDDAVFAVWSVDPTITGVTLTPNGNSIKISVENNDDLVGSTFVLSVTDTNGLYNTATYNVEVV